MKTIVRVAPGVLLILASLPVLFLQGREVWLSVAAGRYELTPYRDSQTLRSCGHEIQLTDSVERRQTHDGRDEAAGIVTVHIDGEAHAAVPVATIRTAFTDANRYFGQMLLASFRDVRTGERALVVASVIPPPAGGASDASRYRITFVGCDGTLREEAFELDERHAPLYRARIVMQLTQRAVGYRSAVLSYQPSPFYPWLYPWLTGAAGIVLLALAVLRRRTPFGTNGRRDALGEFR